MSMTRHFPLRRVWRLLLWVLCVGFVFGVCANMANASGGRISVHGTMLYRNGRPWVPRGVVLVAFTAPQSALRGPFVAARKKFGAAELRQVRRFGADLIRFQVSQSAIDPDSRRYSPRYIDALARAVDLARGMGFAVIVSLQLRPFEAGYGMPGAATVRAWRQLAPRFGADSDVMFELYNEPTLRQPTPANWAAWRDATQPVLDAIRSAGARNIVIVDGLAAGRILSGAPQLRDPLSKVVYGIHPYPVKGNATRSDWDRNFGNFADHHPVLATEWNALPRIGCSAVMPDVARDLLNYLRQKHIGVVGWAFDYPGTLFEGETTIETNYQGFSCGPSGKGGGGKLLRQFFGAQGKTDAR